MCPTSTVGYQFYRPQGGAIDPVTGRFMLDLGLERGFNFGAHFIEVYAHDCNDPYLSPSAYSVGSSFDNDPTHTNCSEQFDSDSNLFIDD